MSNIHLRSALAGASLLVLAACPKTGIEVETDNTPTPEAATQSTEAKVAEAIAFINDAEAQLAAISNEGALTAWAYATDITDEHEKAVAAFDTKATELSVALANGTKKYQGLDLPADTMRKMNFLRGGITIPAPSTQGAAAELANIGTALSSAYSKGKIEFDGATVPQNETELLMRNLRDPAKLTEVWGKWRAQAEGSKANYARMVEIANEGARELGFKDTGQMWRSGYDMDPDDFGAEVDRLWGQVKPLYDELHCHVRFKLNEQYGDEVVPLGSPIRADLLGNMWAQSWGALYDVAKPEGGTATPIELDKILVEKGYDPIKMVETGEAFFSSLGFDPLPDTFWERSQFVKPEGKEVVCHASAWDLDDRDDIRIKMCINVDGDDFKTIHHELGHNYYQRAYKEQPYLFKSGANDGFHEAIGDMVSLSITPAYLKQIGLIDEEPGADGDIDLLMQQALDKVAFLPFGLMVDKWRWQVFSGELTPDTYNDGWWALRKQYQGIVPPLERSADAFDPGSKYHVPNNVPYMRYFLAHILQFQFYKTACEQTGWEGPLHRCSVYGADEIGTKFNAMLEEGQSQPWPETLKLFTGTDKMDGSAILTYFDPLMTYLQEENKDRSCGW